MIKMIAILMLLYGINGLDYFLRSEFNLSGINKMKFTNKRKYLIILNQSSSINIYNGHTLQSLQNISTSMFNNFAISSLSTTLAISNYQGQINIYQTDDQGFFNLSYQLNASTEIISQLSFSASDSLLAVSTQSQNIFILNTSNQYQLQHTIQFPGIINSIAWNPSNFDLLIGGGKLNLQGGILNLYDGHDSFTLKQSIFNESITSKAIFSNDSQFIVKVGGIHEYFAYIINTSTYEVSENISIPNNNTAYSVMISINKQYLTAMSLNKIYIWQYNSSMDRYEYSKEFQANSSVATMSQNGGQILILLNSETVGLLTLCNPEGQAYSPISESCIECNQSCLICDIDSNDCYKCILGYYLSHNMCIACKKGCLECSNASDCQKCEQGYYLNETICQLCSPFCLNCSNSSYCIQCQKKYYLNNSVCNQCVQGCLLCSNSDSCNQCDINNHFIPVGNICECEAGYFDSTHSCISCNIIPFCLVCVSAQNCTQCNQSLNRISSNGSCLCQQGFYEQSQECKQCSSVLVGCTNCSSAKKCTKCNQFNNWILNGSQCNCREEYFIFNQSCLSCSKGCAKCYDAQYCIKCSSVKHWMLNSSSCQCQAGYYEEQEQCNSCGVGCLNCQYLHNCSICDSTNHFIPSEGDCICDTYYVLNKKNICVLCSIIEGCLECSDTNTCTVCKPTFELVAGLCQCAQGTHLQKQGGNCVKDTDNLNPLLVLDIIVSVLGLSFILFYLCK